jgi:predicted nucleotidyltransferase
MQTTPYRELNTVLRELVESVQHVLNESFIAAALQGSFAVGDFDVHSDVDFIVVIENELLLKCRQSACCQDRRYL